MVSKLLLWYIHHNPQSNLEEIYSAALRALSILNLPKKFIVTQVLRKFLSCSSLPCQMSSAILLLPFILSKDFSARICREKKPHNKCKMSNTCVCLFKVQFLTASSTSPNAAAVLKVIIMMISVRSAELLG